MLELRTLLHTALLLKRLIPDLEPAQQQRRCDFLETRFAQLLAYPRPPDTPPGQQEEKMRQRLAKQQDPLLTFLDYLEVDATNNLAERQLRPAFISRKLSCGHAGSDLSARRRHDLAIYEQRKIGFPPVRV